MEFWPCLLEKAYAKFRGSYADNEGGLEYVALNNTTEDDWTEVDVTEDMYYDVCEKLTTHGLVLAACTTDYSNLVSGHSHSVTGFGGDVHHGKCVRVRNPWGQLGGQTGEYLGPEAKVLSTEIDGEFVIKWSEFCKYFSTLTVKSSEV